MAGRSMEERIVLFMDENGQRRMKEKKKMIVGSLGLFISWSP